MIPKHCKRLAEVDFPIAEVSRHAVREKSIRVGHPSTLHLWWARRPLASSRAMLLALLLPDPADPACPPAFKTAARNALLALPSRPKSWDERVATDEGIRAVLLKFIAEFANWDNSAKPAYLTASRALVRAAHPDETPMVVDPFAGGGSIPLEALRLGCDAFASDLNPVACLILKTMLEDIPRRGAELADKLRQAGAQIKAQAERELADLYPTDPDGATPIAYLWARTIRCESPNCGAEIPLMRSMWLCDKAHRKYALRPAITRNPGETPRVDFEIFTPQDDEEIEEASKGTVSRARATCLCCRITTPPLRVRAQLAEQRGGADVVFDDNGNRIGGARMTAVVTLKPGVNGRHYRPPTSADYDVVRKAQARVTALLDDWEQGGKQGLCPVPDEPMPPIGTLGFRVQRYGVLEWGDMFTARQKSSLTALVKAHQNVSDDAVRSGMAIVVDRCANHLNQLARWRTQGETVEGIFSRQALPMVWDFAEVNPFGSVSGNYDGALNSVINVIHANDALNVKAGQVQIANATDHPLPDNSCGVWFTDPPYYNAIPYADLSDFFLIWLKRTLPHHPLTQNPFEPSNPLSSKKYELVQDETKTYRGRPKDSVWFEETTAQAFADGKRVLGDDGIGSVVFAHKTTEGWEALLSGMIRGGWTITASWPIATEMVTRLRALESAVLAGSVHLVCRPRPDDAPVGDWAEALRELPARVGDWMERLQSEGVRGADLVFACVGPALEIFSRYSRVETAAGDAVGLPEYLERVWETVGRAALEQVLGTAEARARNGGVGALEEDSRLTALFLWTLQSGGADEDNVRPARAYASGYKLPYDVARRFAQPLGIHLDEWEGRVVEVKKGEARLLPVKERARELLGESGAAALADTLESAPQPQLSLFPDPPPEVRGRARRGRRISDADFDPDMRQAATTLDRVHAAMLLQSAGRSAAVRNLLAAEQERAPDFMRLANALSALYPRGSEEKRLLDAMLLAAPR